MSVVPITQPAIKMALSESKEASVSVGQPKCHIDWAHWTLAPTHGVLRSFTRPHMPLNSCCLLCALSAEVITHLPVLLQERVAPSGASPLCSHLLKGAGFVNLELVAVQAPAVEPSPSSHESACNESRCVLQRAQGVA